MPSATPPAPPPECVTRLASVQQRMRQAADAAGRPAAQIKLVAVSKTIPPAPIRAVLSAGHRVFGENRVQEAAKKWPPLRQETPGVELHLIGPLQTNKVREALELFDVIHSLDRPRLAAALAHAMAAGDRLPELFVQVNTGEEANKSGIPPGEADAFIALCRESHGLTIAGLSCLPPKNEEPALHFALLDAIARRNGLTDLSMGMSRDFETAIEFGASCIRIGEAIFGPRTHAAPVGGEPDSSPDSSHSS